MKRYTPDFPEMMRLCEMNFSQLRRLLPRNDAPGDNRTDCARDQLLEPSVNDGASVS